jgi:hypothetical protein
MEKYLYTGVATKIVTDKKIDTSMKKISRVQKFKSRLLQFHVFPKIENR